MSAPRIVLVGPMGSGKSTVGRALAHRLGVDHVDTDDMVVARADRSIEAIFETDGEPEFRRLEAAALTEVLRRDGIVVSTGGGIVATEPSRDLLRDGDAWVVWLDGSIDALVERVGSGRGRPLLGTDIRATLRERIAERAPGYLEVADVRIDTSAMRHADCVDAIVAALEGARA